MKCLLLALALVCAVQATAVPQATKDLDIQKLAGPWHSTAMAASDIALLDSKDAPLRVFVKELRPITPSSLEITQSRWENGKCVEKKVLATKTAAAAEFQINNQDATKLYVMDATPETMVVCMEATKAA
ncbi:glycodelin, partial [Talpa occidentalis]|uniref:glycodelin n=1 Tax=Talpa occidentalis TaxID=50954 RepID=UPI0023F7E3BC